MVCVNRSARPWRVSGIGVPGGWFAYNTLEGLDTGLVNSTTFVLKPYGGWACYNPFESSPSIPRLLSPSSASSTQSYPIVLKWDQAAGGRLYHVQVASDPDFTAPLVLDVPDIAARLIEVRNLETSTTYFWRVRAMNNTGGSDWSEVWSFETGNRGRRD